MSRALAFVTLTLLTSCYSAAAPPDKLEQVWRLPEMLPPPVPIAPRRRPPCNVCGYSMEHSRI